MGFSAFFADTRNSSCPAVTSESMFCNDTCKDDFYCQSFEKCCSTGCGRTCQNSTGLRFVTRTQKTHLRHACTKIRNVINKSILVKRKRFVKHACKKIYIYIQTFYWKNYGLKKTMMLIILFCFFVTRPTRIWSSIDKWYMYLQHYEFMSNMFLRLLLLFSDFRTNYTDYLSYPISRVLPKNGKTIGFNRMKT